MLLNYTTKIDAWQTVGEIQQILGKAGASHVNIKMDQGQPGAITFALDYNGAPLNFLIPCNVKGINKYFEALKGTEREKLVRNGFYAKLKADNKLASSIGWRIVKDWVEAQCAIVELELATLPQIFLHSVIVSASGETLSDRMLQGGGLKLLNK